MTTTHSIGDLVYVSVNGGRGVSLAKLISRHGEDSWDVDFHPGLSREPSLHTVAEADFVPDPYAQEEDDQ